MGIGDAQPSTTTKKATGQNSPVDRTKKICAETRNKITRRLGRPAFSLVHCHVLLTIHITKNLIGQWSYKLQEDRYYRMQIISRLQTCRRYHHHQSPSQSQCIAWLWLLQPSSAQGYVPPLRP